MLAGSQSVAEMGRQAHRVYNGENRSMKEEHINSFSKVKGIFRENLTF